jgi:uncharacterized protein (DUF433 family)
MTPLVIDPQPVPIYSDERGDLRVGQSRVLLDLVINAFREGLTPDAIVRRYDTLQIAEVYGAITYYLTHLDEIDRYLQAREEEAQAVRAKIEAGQPPRPGFRDELLRRRTAGGNGHAPAGQ